MPFHFDKLPTELRLAILNQLFQIENPANSLSHPSRLPVLEYALVNHEWQSFFEERLFRKLVVDDYDVARLSRLSPRRTRLVEFVWLRVKLLTYDCDWAGDVESEEDGKANNRQVRQLVKDLFNSLYEWEECHPDLMLEFSAHSPSDTEHIFHHLSFDENTLNEHAVDHVPVTASLDHEPPTRSARRRIHGTPISPAENLYGRAVASDEMSSLPILLGVKRFRLRRHNRRPLWRSFLQALLDRMPNLEVIQYEEWRDLNMFDMGVFGRYNSRYSVKEFRLFRDFSNIPPEDNPLPCIGASLQLDEHVFAHELLTMLTALERLSLSFAVEASTFLSHLCYDEYQPVLPNLAFISLTDSRLHPMDRTDPLRRLSNHEPPTAVANNLLQSAAASASRLPKLQIMEIWYAKKGHAYMFRYKSVPKALPEPEIVSSGTWDLQLSDETLGAWHDFSLTRTEEPLKVKKNIFEPDTILSHGDAIRRLGLEVEVVDSVSLNQICIEGAQDHRWHGDFESDVD